MDVMQADSINHQVVKRTAGDLNKVDLPIYIQN